jgi:hypothetical protein
MVMLAFVPGALRDIQWANKYSRGPGCNNPNQSIHHVLQQLQPPSFATSTPGSALHLLFGGGGVDPAVLAPLVIKDYSDAASSYFTSIRVPAALIAGSSLSALFALVRESRDAMAAKRSRLETAVLIGHHLCALLSLTLSVNTIVTATATSNAILLGRENPMASSAYALLLREYEFEFLMTRWSFFVGLFSFLGSVAARALIEFGLLQERRVRSALLVGFSFSTLFFHLLSFVNSRLQNYANMGAMTIGVLHMWFQRSVSRRHPAELTSVACFIGAVFSSLSLISRIALFSKRDSVVNGGSNGSNEIE